MVLNFPREIQRDSWKFRDILGGQNRGGGCYRHQGAEAGDAAKDPVIQPFCAFPTTDLAC